MFGDAMWERVSEDLRDEAWKTGLREFAGEWRKGGRAWDVVGCATLISRGSLLVLKLLEANVPDPFRKLAIYDDVAEDSHVSHSCGIVRINLFFAINYELKAIRISKYNIFLLGKMIVNTL
jgi:hypothetical protein